MALTDVTGVTLTGMWSYLRKETSTSWQKWTGAPQRSGNSQPVAECDSFTNPGYGPEPCLRGRNSLQEGGHDALSPVPGICLQGSTHSNLNFCFTSGYFS